MAGEMAERIGARIRARRTELGMKQRELADMLGNDAVDNQRISDWERGVNRPSDRYMEKLAAALQRDVSWFFQENPDAETPDPFPQAPALEGALGDVLREIKDQLAQQTRVLDEIKAHASRVEEMLDAQRILKEETDDLAETIRRTAREMRQPQASRPDSPPAPQRTAAARKKRAAASRTP